MKNYFVNYTNGDCDFFEAKTDNSAYKKAIKMAKEHKTGIAYLAEQMEDLEEDRIIFRK